MRARTSASLLASLTALTLLVSGCGRDRKTEGDGDVASSATTAGGADHVHERGKMLIADVGRHHALLTAHLSPKGNELDLFFETSKKAPSPVAIASTPLTGFARRQGGEVKEVRFECAPASERPKGEKVGTCSHFVAKTPWLTRDEVLELTIPSVKVGDGTHRVQWKDFTPARYAHHEE